MRRWMTLALAMVAWAGGMAISPDALAASKRIKPSGDHQVVRVRVGRNLRTYYEATSARPLEFKIKGPAAVRVLSRCLFAGEPPSAPVAYQLRLEIDGVELRTLRGVGGVSGNATLANGEDIGALTKTVVRIPAGSHKVRVFPVEEGETIALRLLSGSGRPLRVNWLPFAPETSLQPVLLHSRDSEVTYYRFSGDTPVTLSITGPVRLKIMTRLDFGQARGYSQTYTVRTFVDGELLQNDVLSTRASPTSTYPDLPEITPGVGRDIMVEVPDGKHEIAIGLDGTTAGAAALRILIPEQAVTNGT